MPTSRVKTNLFLTFEIATKWQNVGYTRRSYGLISLNQPKRERRIMWGKSIFDYFVKQDIWPSEARFLKYYIWYIIGNTNKLGIFSENRIFPENIGLFGAVTIPTAFCILTRVRAWKPLSVNCEQTATSNVFNSWHPWPGINEAQGYNFLVFKWLQTFRLKWHFG